MLASPSFRTEALMFHLPPQVQLDISELSAILLTIKPKDYLARYQ